MKAATQPEAWRIGRGNAAIELVRGRSVCVSDHASTPLKLLCPDQGGPAAWVYTSTYGGGLVAGDRIELDLSVGAEAVAVLATQASTKVYHQQDGRGAEQHLRVSVAAGGLLVCAPDPLTCFADAVYEQRQRFELAGGRDGQPGASLVLIDWFTAGRAAMGESWAFARYASRNDLVIDGQLVARESLRLDRDEIDLRGALVTGGYHCLATVLLAGPVCDAAGQAWHDAIAAEPLRPEEPVQFSASRWPWGTVIRVAAQRTTDAAALLRERLSFLTPLLGRGVWDRKW